MPEEEVHNHRYDFRSYVLKGCLSQEIYNVERDIIERSSWIMEDVSCDPDNPAPDIKNHRYLSLSVIVDTHAGSDYEILKNTFHKVRPAKEPTITLVKRGVKSKEFAQVIRNNSAEKVCPFFPKMSVKEIWDWVDHICLE